MSNAPTRAIPKPPGKVSPIWLVPIVAALVGLWMVWHNISTRGPTITIRMDTAEGIEPLQTLVKSREVAVGKVVDVSLSEEFDHTEVTVRMNPGTQRLLRVDTRFWVVRPRIGREGISGLSTVLSGSYIQLQPGFDETPEREFVALEKPPSALPGTRGIRLTLIGDQVTAISTGDAVDFQGFNVGQVESADFDVDKRQLISRLFIRAPFDRLVTRNTRFWQSSGVQVRLGANGVSVGMGSLESLIGGGVSFGVPEGLSRGEPAQPGQRFTLYSDEEAAREGTFDRVLQYVLLSEDSVRGLRAGAPVEYRGVRVGTVAEVPYKFTGQTALDVAHPTIPILIHIEPQRLDGQSASIDDVSWRARIANLFDNGLRASLSSGNLLTGALLVDLDFVEDVPAFERQAFDGIEVFPSANGGLGQLQDKLASLLDKLNDLEIEPVMSRLESGLAEASKMLASLDALLADPATRQVPKELKQTMQELRQTLDGVSPDGLLYQDLSRTMRRLDRLMNDLAPLMRTLNEQPNALIFDRDEVSDPTPPAAKHAN